MVDSDSCIPTFRKSYFVKRKLLTTVLSLVLTPLCLFAVLSPLMAAAGGCDDVQCEVSAVRQLLTEHLSFTTA